jgi:hypothetical protein
MNFGWLTPTTSDDEYSRVVTHEFGHAMGCIHEHQNPVAGIPWNKPVVYGYYEGPPNNWTKREVDTNLFDRYSTTLTQFSNFDPASIMEYPIPAQFTNGQLVIGMNKELSATDKSFVAGQYPLAPPTEPELQRGSWFCSLPSCSLGSVSGSQRPRRLQRSHRWPASPSAAQRSDCLPGCRASAT